MKKSYQLCCLLVAFPGFQLNKNISSRHVHLLDPTVNRNKKFFLFAKSVLLFILCLLLSAGELLKAATYTLTSGTGHPGSGGVNTGSGVITGGAGNGQLFILSAIVSANANPVPIFSCFQHPTERSMRWHLPEPMKTIAIRNASMLKEPTVLREKESFYKYESFLQVSF